MVSCPAAAGSASEGRVRMLAADALARITKAPLPADSAAWKRWWEQNRDNPAFAGYDHVGAREGGPCASPILPFVPLWLPASELLRPHIRRPPRRHRVPPEVPPPVVRHHHPPADAGRSPPQLVSRQ